jgi:hypothetical protein
MPPAPPSGDGWAMLYLGGATITTIVAVEGERDMSTSGGRDARQFPRRSTPAPRRAIIAAWRLILVTLGAVALMTAADTAAARANVADAAPSLTIVSPQGLQGPATTNITAKVTGAQKGHTFDVGYAPQSGGCTAATFVQISGAPTVSAQSDGSATFTFAWPTSADMGNYYVCLRDQASPLVPVQSTNLFDDLSSTPPSVEIAPAATNTNGNNGGASSTPSPGATGPGGTYTTGEQVQVSGFGFLPGGTSVAVFLSGSPTELGTQLSQQQINVDTQGNFVAVVSLPTTRAGPLNIQVATLDAANGRPPSLLAYTPISIGLTPTATPSPSPTPTVAPTASATPKGTPNTGGGGGDSARTLGVAGLGSLSALLLLIGTFLIVSAGRATREE